MFKMFTIIFLFLFYYVKAVLVLYGVSPIASCRSFNNCTIVYNTTYKPTYLPMLVQNYSYYEYADFNVNITRDLYLSVPYDTDKGKFLHFIGYYNYSRVPVLDCGLVVRTIKRSGTGLLDIVPDPVYCDNYATFVEFPFTVAPGCQTKPLDLLRNRLDSVLPYNSLPLYSNITSTVVPLVFAGSRNTDLTPYRKGYGLQYMPIPASIQRLKDSHSAFIQPCINNDQQRVKEIER
nr:hypothetical protein [Hepelivirales sp.]